VQIAKLLIKVTKKKNYKIQLILLLYNKKVYKIKVNKKKIFYKVIIIVVAKIHQVKKK
jgi:hypothetical protein